MIKMGLDLGSNRIKYSIIDTTTFKVLRSESDYYALFKNFDSNNNIPEKKILDTIRIIENYKRIGAQYKVQKIKAVGTAGLRKAKNADYFIKRIKEATGVDIKIISGVDEARYTWTGALLSFTDNNANYVVIDIGGASTEFSQGNKEKMIKAKSIDIGTQSFTSRFNTETRDITDDELPGMEHFILSKINSINIPYSSNNMYILTGSSGIIVLQAERLDLRGPANKWNKKPVWPLSKELVDRSYKIYQHDKTCDDPTLCFAQTFILSIIMKKLQIPMIYYSITTLKEGVVLT